MLRLNKQLVISIVVLLFCVALFYNFNQITGSFYAGTDWGKDWENRLVVELDNDLEYYESRIDFGVYKPTDCYEGILVTDGLKLLKFTLFDEEYIDGVCVSTGISIKNPVYSERRIAIAPTVVEEPVRRIGITGRVTFSPLTLYIYYGKKPVLPEYNKLQNDPEFDVVVLSTQLENNSLIVTFYHTSELTRQISIDGDINYLLSTNSSEGYQNVTLTVPNWADQYFQLVVE